MPKRIHSGNGSSTRDSQLPVAGSGESIFVRGTRWLIWVYLILWIVEGALRKWFLPGLSNPLLVVRDPVVILIYLTAFAGNVFPMNRIVGSLMALGVVSLRRGIPGYRESSHDSLLAFARTSCTCPLSMSWVRCCVRRIFGG